MGAWAVKPVDLVCESEWILTDAKYVYGVSMSTLSLKSRLHRRTYGPEATDDKSTVPYGRYERGRRQGTWRVTLYPLLCFVPRPAFME